MKNAACCLLALPLLCGSASSQTNSPDTYPIDLPTVLRLAGAQSLDVQIARERVREAEANRQAAIEQFLPSLAAGVSYHRRDGVAQAVPSGVISDAHFQSYSPGVTLAAQVALGDAIYSSLAAKQTWRAADHALESRRQDSVLAAAQQYFELAKAKGQAEVLQDAVRTSEAYQQQLHAAVASGIAFKGDELRIQSQTEHYILLLRQATEQSRVAAAELARILHLDPALDLVPQANELVPLVLMETNVSRDVLIAEGLNARPELKERQALVLAARAGKKGAVYGPWIPSVGAQVFGGGLGGGPDSGPGHFGAEGDYSMGLSWRIGPGGLLDRPRIHAHEARLAMADLEEAKVKDSIVAQVVTAVAHLESLNEQIELAKRNVGTARELLRLTRERKQYGVGIVLEDIQAQQDLTQSQSELLRAIAEYNKAQYALAKATGRLGEPGVTNAPDPARAK